MSDPISHFFLNLQNIIPWVSFLAGMGGSLHCVGMCGGLVTATCQKQTDVYRYQLGRLLGYLFLGLMAGLIGKALNFKSATPALSILPGLLIGILFLIWGLQNLRGKKAEIPLPGFMHTLYQNLWKKLIKNNQNFSRAFFIGLLSILLPCGMLYGVVLGAAAFENSWSALYAMFFFWLGTVPSMILAPSIVQKLLRPLKNKLPKTYAISLILIGVLTIAFRLTSSPIAHANHKDHSPDAKHSCH